MIEVLNMNNLEFPGFAEKLASHFVVHTAPNCEIPLASGKIRALVPGKLPVDKALLDRLTALEIISLLSVGYDRVDVAAAAARGIRVTNTPDVLSDDVADLAIAMLIMVSRRLRQADRLVRAGGWRVQDPVFGTAATGKRLGILGLGRIGRAIAQRAVSMGIEIAYTNRNKTDVPYRFVPDLITLARESDILIVAAAAGLETYHLVNRQVIEALGPDGILINVARGNMVDEDAMTDALRTGQLGGAGLDVFEHEPYVHEALLKLENVVLTPHIGSATVETRTEMGDLVIANLTAYFEGRPLVSEVPESRAFCEARQ